MPGDDDARRRRRALAAIEGGKVRGRNPHINDDYPLTPIGVGPGTTLVFLDSFGMLQIQTAREMGRNPLARFFANEPGWLLRHHPRPKRGQNAEEAETFKPESAFDQLANACGWEGMVDLATHVRGRGAHRGDDGDLVLHLGDQLWLRGRTAPIGRRGRHVYPAGPALPYPADEAQPATDGPGAEMLAMLSSWRWAHDEFDALLLLGWIGAAMVGGALDVRPAIWVSGSAGVGKSTLQGRISALFGAGLLASDDCTGAGLWQKLGYDCLPVAVDEAEPRIENSRLEQIVLAMRVSYSGGELHRGSSAGVAHEYTLRSAFMFGSIAVPSLPPQDWTRCVLIEMEKLPAGTGLRIVPNVAALGRRLLRRMADCWDRLVAEDLPAYRAALVAAGWDGRNAETVGTLLACASVLLDDQHRVAPDLEAYGDELAAMLAQRRADQRPEGLACLERMTGTLIDAFGRGERRTIGELLRVAAGFGPAPIGDDDMPGLPRMERSDTAAAVHAATDENAREASRVLRRYGLKITYSPNGRVPRERMLAIANTNPLLQQDVFRATPWGGMVGASSAWQHPLARLPGALPGGSVRFVGPTTRVTLLPLETVLGRDEDTGAAAPPG